MTKLINYLYKQMGRKWLRQTTLAIYGKTKDPVN